MKNPAPYIKNLLLEEAERWILWLPVFLGLGIVAYFALPYEPSQRQLAGMVAGVATLGLISRRRHPALKIAAFAAAVFVLGFAVAKLRADAVSSPVIYDLKKPFTISGNIDSISYSSGFPVLVLENLRIDNIDQRYLPEKIRLNVRTRFKEEVRPGDRIITDAHLLEPARPAIPGGYDFARYAHFRGIGATGFAVKQIVKLKKGGVTSYIEDMRYEISQRIRAATSGDKGAVSEALITGERAYISRETYENMRKAGLAHLLAVSGMNLAMVAAIVFFVLRSGFALNYRLSEVYSAKKIAAAIAILCNVFYLIISGNQPSVQRAFIMVSIIMVGILLDRQATPMRSVAVSALVIMLFYPESVLNPGFQMSFAAVAALIAAYELLVRRGGLFNPERVNDDSQKWYQKFYNKLWLYPLSVMMSSAIAGLATAPFAVYHFNQFSGLHGVIANLIAVPTVSFLVMPFAVLGMALMPFGLEHIGFVPMSYGVSIILWVAKTTAAMKGAAVMAPQMPFWGFALVVSGGLWLLIWQKKWRYAGLAFIFAGMLSLAFVKQPDIIINDNGKLFAVNRDGKLYLSNMRSSFAAREWLAHFAQEKPLKLPKVESYEVKGYRMEIRNSGTPEFRIYNPKFRVLTITAAELAKEGTHNIYFTETGIIVKTVSSTRGKRLWVTEKGKGRHE